MEKVFHNIKPLYDKESKILILGSMPSPKSREQQFFYGHPKNRFWLVMSKILDAELPNTIEQKKNMILNNHIAMWDVIKECEISGASDSSIKNAVPNNFDIIFKVADIKKIFTTGYKAHFLLKKLTGLDSIYLPSTSPANQTLKLETIIKEYSVILDYIK